MFHLVCFIITFWVMWKLAHRNKKKPRTPPLGYKERVKLKRAEKFVSEGDSRISVTQFRKKL